MHYPLRSLSMIGLITLSLNALADTPGGFNSILLSAASGPATQAGKLPAASAAIKGLPANLGGQKSPVLPASTSSGAVESPHLPAQTLLSHKQGSSVTSQTSTSVAAAARPATIAHPPMAYRPPQKPVPPQPVGARMSAANHGPRLNLPRAMSGPPPLSTPAALPSQPPSRMKNSVQGANPAATGYVNPFVGQPGVIEKLSNRLAVIKLKNEIAKEQAAGAKYRTEYATLSQNNSPQMQALAQSMNQMKARLAQLESRQAKQERIHHAIQREKANPSMVLVGILRNDGVKYALLQAGKHLLTLSKGDSAGNTSVQSIGVNSIQLANGDRLRVSSSGVGHYAATSWKGTQSGGGILPPQSSVSAGLMNEARQAGIPLPGAGGQAPTNNKTQMIHFQTPGIQP